MAQDKEGYLIQQNTFLHWLSIEYYDFDDRFRRSRMFQRQIDKTRWMRLITITRYFVFNSEN